MMLGRHWEIWQAALDAEKKRKLPSFARGYETEFLPGVLEVLETPPSPLGRKMLGVICSFFALVILWAGVSEIDIIATSTGKTIPSGKTKIIQHLEAGRIAYIAVEEGQHVEEGQLLLELDPTETQADKGRLQNEIMDTMVQIAKARALIMDGYPLENFDPPAQAPLALVAMHRNLMLSRFREYQAEIEAMEHDLGRQEAALRSITAETTKLEKVLPLLQERVDAKRSLLREGHAAPLTVLEIEQQLIETKEEITVRRHRQNELQSGIGSLRQKRQQTIEQFQRQNLAEIAEAERKVASLQQELVKAEQKHERQTMHAPVSGKVQQIAINTIGGVVTPAQQLMSIVPDSFTLEAEVMILNKDIGFVEEGQDVGIKIETFNFTKYGLLPGKVRRLSYDAVKDEKLGLVYPALVTIEKTFVEVNGRKVPLTPGMSLTGEIKIGTRKLIEYILSPIARYKNESFVEP